MQKPTRVDATVDDEGAAAQWGGGGRGKGEKKSGGTVLRAESGK